jgi:hypothetical protein
MTNDELSPNDEIRKRAEGLAKALVIRASSFLRHSALVIRH